MAMLEIIDEIRTKTDLGYREICTAVRLPYPSFMRWRMRKRNLVSVVKQPGPPKIGPPDFSGLVRDIAGMAHGHRRTQGTGALYVRYASGMSRRDIYRLVSMARHDLNAQHRQNQRRIRWNVPNVAWSMDPSLYGQRDASGEKVYLTQMQDLASRYKFSPMAGECPCGEEIAGYVADKFQKFGPPLFLKRDNGGNLNHPAVDDVLSEHFVIPLNSPVHYPPYNGAIEKAQTELKNGLVEKLAYRPCCPREHVEAYAAAVEHDLNHQPRPCLEGKIACQVFFTNRRAFSKWERRDAYVWIKSLQNDILCTEGVQPQAAWRIAAEAWLSKNGFITVTQNGKVSPNFF
jgi:hypothetical protein